MNTTTHKFTVGTYKTRDGREAVVLADDIDKRADSLLGYIRIAGRSKQVRMWHPNGRYFLSGISLDDLMPQPPPEPKYRPWNTGEIPLGAWLRAPETPEFTRLVICTGNRHVVVASLSDISSMAQISTSSLLYDGFTHSVDSGKTWLPCGVPEVTK
jgi:hypothetical protein